MIAFISTSGQQKNWHKHWWLLAVKHLGNIRRGDKMLKARNCSFRALENRWGNSALLAPFCLQVDSACLASVVKKTTKRTADIASLPQKSTECLVCTLECLFLGRRFCSFSCYLYPGLLHFIAFFWEGTTINLLSFIIFYHCSHVDNYIPTYDGYIYWVNATVALLK